MVTNEALDAAWKALADPTRREILEALDGDALAVLAVADRFPSLSRPAVSKHLRVLREAGLVEERRDGRQRFYRRVAAPLRAVEEWLATMTRSAGRPGDRGSRPLLTTRPRIDPGDWRCW